jgi:quercetin dioxygenase-like cupin family protein
VALFGQYDGGPSAMIEPRQNDEVSLDECVILIGTSTTQTEISGRDKIVRLEAEVSKLPQLEVVPRHYFAEGVYAREITIPKGAVLVGRVHKHSQINIVSRGDATVRTESGVIRVQAPYTVASPRGAKRAIYAHEETVWTTLAPRKPIQT